MSKIFLFRSLDKEQTLEVLDAMFEKKVHLRIVVSDILLCLFSPWAVTFVGGCWGAAYRAGR